MTFYYYTGLKKKRQEGNINLIKVHDISDIEMDIEADGWTYHTIIGKHRDGNYICIPNWSIGSELAGLQDIFWNSERLREHTGLEEDQANAIAGALYDVGQLLN